MSRNSFTDMFQPTIGETRNQLVVKLETVLALLRQWLKNGYEHDATSCKQSTTVNGELRGGWISPRDLTCSLCGFWAGGLRNIVLDFDLMLQHIRQLPEGYRYGATLAPPKKKEQTH